MLPKINGYEICRLVRAQKLEMPIIMLTAKGEESDIILGLNLGADDYVTKPFSPRELQARVKAVLRRMVKGPDDPEENLFRYGELEVDFLQYECRISGRKVGLTAHEFGLLKYLIQNRERVIERDELLAEVWGKDVVVSVRTIDTHMANLRKKLEDDANLSRFIISMRGVGYKFASK